MKRFGGFAVLTLFFLTSCEFGIRKNPNVKNPEAEFPLNAVVAFNSSTCPDGWTEFTELNGRSILGAGSGNIDTYGSALTSRSLHDEGGLTFTSSIPASSQSANLFMPYSGTEVLGTTNFSMYSDISGSNGLMAGTEGNMAPYFVQKFCKNTANHSVVPAGAIIARKTASCPANWSEPSTLRGRMIVGEGSGNLDVTGASLPARSLAAYGGYEETVLDLIINQNISSEQSPDGMTLGTVVGLIYSTQPPDSSFAGSLTDSNMPPFTVVQYCGSPSAAAKVESGTVLAFDQSTCPSGWSAYLPARGRILFGAGSGNQSGSGKTLTPRTVGQAGGLEYTTGLPFYSDAGDNDTPESEVCFAADPGHANYLVDAPPDSFLYGYYPSANLPPFYTLLYCEKN